MSESKNEERLAKTHDAGTSAGIVEQHGATIVCAIGILTALYFAFVQRLAVSMLVLAALALLATVFALWNSVRVVAGDGELPADFKEARFERSSNRRALLERKNSVLRALKDLENERAIGKISQEDFDDVAGRYRQEAKELLRQLDDVPSELREKAEKAAKDHLKKLGLGGKEAVESPTEEAEKVEPSALSTHSTHSTHSTKPPPPKADGQALESELHENEGDRTVVARHICPACAASNELDAKFCKACGVTMNKGKSA